MTEPSAPPELPTRTTSGTPPARTDLVLLVVSGAARGQKLKVSEQLTVGKATDNDLVLPDDTVSRHHCVFERRSEGVVVRDLGSTNHTRVGRTAVVEATVEPGAMIMVGDVELMLRSEPERGQVLPSASPRFGEMIGTSLAMRGIFGLLEGIAPTDASVLIEGEAGTGKDLLARSIHALSARKPHEFIAVDCGAVPHDMLEGELFGHERGSNANPAAVQAGAFELAGEGTVFLDEVGELPLEVQPKLLRVLESAEFRRVGGTKALRAQARVIAATKRNLREEVERGKFREDLYLRLSVVPVRIPPLRERREDIPPLVEHFLEHARGAIPAAANISVNRETLAALSAHDWPGNVRELRNVLERAIFVAAAGGKKDVHLVDVPAPVAAFCSLSTAFPAFAPGKSYREVRAEFEADFERRYVSWLLDRHGGNISAAAREAKMDRKHLYDLARKHGLRGERS